MFKKKISDEALLSSDQDIRVNKVIKNKKDSDTLLEELNMVQKDMEKKFPIFHTSIERE